jgi:hypothetical protein
MGVETLLKFDRKSNKERKLRRKEGGKFPPV